MLKKRERKRRRSVGTTILITVTASVGRDFSNGCACTSTKWARLLSLNLYYIRLGCHGKPSSLFPSHHRVHRPSKWSCIQQQPPQLTRVLQRLLAHWIHQHSAASGTPSQSMV